MCWDSAGVSWPALPALLGVPSLVCTCPHSQATDWDLTSHFCHSCSDLSHRASTEGFPKALHSLVLSHSSQNASSRLLKDSKLHWNLKLRSREQLGHGVSTTPKPVEKLEDLLGAVTGSHGTSCLGQRLSVTPCTVISEACGPDSCSKGTRKPDQVAKMQDRPERKNREKKRPLWHFHPGAEGQSWACPAQIRVSGSLAPCG